jgi:hypothetical protein
MESTNTEAIEVISKNLTVPLEPKDKETTRLIKEGTIFGEHVH